MDPDEFEHLRHECLFALRSYPSVEQSDTTRFVLAMRLRAMADALFTARDFAQVERRI